MELENEIIFDTAKGKEEIMNLRIPEDSHSPQLIIKRADTGNTIYQSAASELPYDKNNEDDIEIRNIDVNGYTPNRNEVDFPENVNKIQLNETFLDSFVTEQEEESISDDKTEDNKLDRDYALLREYLKLSVGTKFIFRWEVLWWGLLSGALFSW